MISVESLMVAGDLAKISGWADGGDGPLSDPGHSRSVVTEVFQGGVAHRMAVRHDI